MPCYCALWNFTLKANILNNEGYRSFTCCMLYFRACISFITFILYIYQILFVYEKLLTFHKQIIFKFAYTKAFTHHISMCFHGPKWMVIIVEFYMVLQSILLDLIITVLIWPLYAEFRLQTLLRLVGGEW